MLNPFAREACRGRLDPNWEPDLILLDDDLPLDRFPDSPLNRTGNLI